MEQDDFNESWCPFIPLEPRASRSMRWAVLLESSPPSDHDHRHELLVRLAKEFIENPYGIKLS